MKPVNPAIGALTTLVSLALLAGCGGGGESSFAEESAADILAATRTAMKSVDSATLSGEIVTAGQTTGLDLSVTPGGEQCAGTVEVMGGKAEILGADNQLWFKPDEAFWKASAPPPTWST